jgi:hypothetical protein
MNKYHVVQMTELNAAERTYPHYTILDRNDNFVAMTYAGDYAQTMCAALNAAADIKEADNTSANIPSTQCGDCGECCFQSAFSSKCKLGRSNE